MTELAALLDAATGPSRELDWRIEHIVVSSPVFDASRPDFWPPFMVNSRADKDIPRYTSSIDAALALVERLLPGWKWEVGQVFWRDGIFVARLARPGATDWSSSLVESEDAPTAPFAILKALVAALIAQEKTNE